VDFLLFHSFEMTRVEFVCHLEETVLWPTRDLGIGVGCSPDTDTLRFLTSLREIRNDNKKITGGCLFNRWSPIPGRILEEASMTLNITNL